MVPVYGLNVNIRRERLVIKLGQQQLQKAQSG